MRIKILMPDEVDYDAHTLGQDLASEKSGEQADFLQSFLRGLKVVCKTDHDTETQMLYILQDMDFASLGILKTFGEYAANEMAGRKV